MNLGKIKEIAKSQGKTLGGVAEAAGLTSPGLDYIIKENNTKVDVLQRIAHIDFDRKKVDKANRKLIDLIKQRAAGDEHDTDGPHSGAV